MGVVWFNFKKELALAFPKIALSGVENTDERLTNLIEHFEYSAEEHEQMKKTFQKQIRSLGALIKKADNKEQLKKEVFHDFKKYERLQLKQLEEYRKIVLFLRNLIENEDIEILYDIRNPLAIYESFFNHLKKVLEKMTVPRSYLQHFSQLLGDILKEYEKILDQVQKYLEDEFRYLGQVGYETNFNVHGRVNLELHLKNRILVKKQIQAKILYIRKRMEHLISALDVLVKTKHLDGSEVEKLKENITYFLSQFEGLTTYTLQRIDVARSVIMESITLQKEYLEKIDSSIKEFHQMYDDFEKDYEDLHTNATTNYRKTFYAKRKDEVSKRRDRFLENLTTLRRELDIDEYKADRNVKKILRDEARESRRLPGTISRLHRQVGKIAASIVLLVSLGSAAGEISGSANNQPPQNRPASTVVQPMIHQTAPQGSFKVIVEGSASAASKITERFISKTGFIKLIEKKEKRVISQFESLIQTEGVKILIFPGEKRMVIVSAKSETKIIDFVIRGGPKEAFQDINHPGHIYGPTPQGIFTLHKDDIKPYVQRNSSWVNARIAFGALIRENNGIIQFSEDEGLTWLDATGKNAVVKGFTPNVFYYEDQKTHATILYNRWYLNPFGHLTMELRDKKGNILGEKIHPNSQLSMPGAAEMERFNDLSSHGCINMVEGDLDLLNRILAMSTQKSFLVFISNYNTVYRGAKTVSHNI
jgi:tetratricopeptide (TPR) repeat protein